MLHEIKAKRGIANKAIRVIMDVFSEGLGDRKFTKLSDGVTEEDMSLLNYLWVMEMTLIL